jgi:hypothetical protein
MKLLIRHLLSWRKRSREADLYRLRQRIRAEVEEEVRARVEEDAFMRGHASGVMAGRDYWRGIR